MSSDYGANFGTGGGFKYQHPGDGSAGSAPGHQSYDASGYAPIDPWAASPQGPVQDQSQYGHQGSYASGDPGQQNTGYPDNSHQYGHAGGFGSPQPSGPQYPQHDGNVDPSWPTAPPSDPAPQFQPQGGYGQSQYSQPASLPASHATGPPLVAAAPIWPAPSVPHVVPAYPQHQPQSADTQGVPPHVPVDQYGRPYSQWPNEGNTSYSAPSSDLYNQGSGVPNTNTAGYDDPNYRGDNQLTLPDDFRMPGNSEQSTKTNADRSVVWLRLREQKAATLDGPFWWRGNWLPDRGQEYNSFREKFQSVTGRTLRDFDATPLDTSNSGRPPIQQAWSPIAHHTASSGLFQANPGTYGNSSGQTWVDENPLTNPAANWKY